jgi:hypothetical protein
MMQCFRGNGDRLYRCRDESKFDPLGFDGAIIIFVFVVASRDFGGDERVIAAGE